MVIDGVSGGLASELELKLQDTKNGFITKLLGNGQIRPPKFDTWCRVTNIFRLNNKGWMAMLLWRRALLVFCFTASSASGGKLYLPSGLGVDYRLLPFLLIVIYVILQAHSKPFGLDSDNALEQCVLMALLLVIFADIALNKPIFSGDALMLKSPIVAMAVVGVLSMIIMHKRARKEGAALARIGMTGDEAAASAKTGSRSDGSDLLLSAPTESAHDGVAKAKEFDLQVTIFFTLFTVNTRELKAVFWFAMCRNWRTSLNSNSSK